jgi:NADP-dependent alcohol dehydrogenase
MNCTAVITHNQGKFVLSSPLVIPGILFPGSNPDLFTAAPSGCQRDCRHLRPYYRTIYYLSVDAGFQDRTAEGILQTLIEIGRKTIDEPEDYDARANLVWCATMALNGLIGAGVPQDWTSHMIGHELTALFHIDHGTTLAILLPSVLTVLKDQKRAKLLQYAERVWNINEGSEDSRIEEAIVKTRKFFESLV